MIKSIICCFVFFGFLGVVAAEEPSAQESKDLVESEFNYFFGPGDTLDIKVWRHPDLDMKVIVRPDCGISYPIINEIAVCDLTIEELRNKLALGIGTVIRDPQIAINVDAIESLKVFVLGEVVRPGIYPLGGRMNVLEAISRAGGYDKDSAVLNSIVVIRPSRGQKAQAMRVDLSSVIHQGDMKQNIILRSGDIVFVPKSFIAKLNTFIDQFFTKTDPVLRYYLDIIDIDQRTPEGRSR